MYWNCNQDVLDWEGLPLLQQQLLRRIASAISERAVSSPSSVEFMSMVNINIPAHCDWCEVLAVHGGGWQHEVLALCQMKLSSTDGGQGVEDKLWLEYQGGDCEIFEQYYQIQSVDQLHQTQIWLGRLCTSNKTKMR
jgi:hypothetical protein